MIRAALILSALTISTSAAAGPELKPDRAGLGENAQSAGLWEGTVEGGAQLQLSDPIVVGTEGITGRLGVGKGFELRLTLPDVITDGNGVGTSRLTIGGKYAYPVTSELKTSAVLSIGTPYLTGDGAEGGVAMRGAVNIAFDKEKFGVWGHGAIDLAMSDDIIVLLFIGAGGMVDLGPVKPFVHAGYRDNGDIMAGVGVALPLSDSAQLDAGIDGWFFAGPPDALWGNVYAGGSVAF